MSASRLLLIMVFVTTSAWAELSPPPVLQENTTAQNQYFQDIYNNQNLPPTVKVNPNGNRYGNYGQIVRYFDGTSYTLYSCVSSPSGKQWQPITDPSCHGIPAGGAASSALIKLSATDYDVGWASIDSLVSKPSIFSTFGGNSASGAIVVAADTNFSAIGGTNTSLQCTSLTIDATKTLTVDKGFAFIGVAGDCHIHGTISANGTGALGGAGGAANGLPGENSLGFTDQTAGGNVGTSQIGTIGLGGAAGSGRNAAATSAGNGGGSGSVGGVGTIASAAATPYFKTDNINWACGPNNLLAILLASRGGGGGGGAHAADPGAGGNGGGVIYIEVNGSLDFDGTLTANGANVADHTGRGGQGGGGTIIIRSKNISVNTGTVTVNPSTNDGASATGGLGANGYYKIVQL